MVPSSCLLLNLCPMLVPYSVGSPCLPSTIHIFRSLFNGIPQLLASSRIGSLYATIILDSSCDSTLLYRSFLKLMQRKYIKNYRREYIPELILLPLRHGADANIWNNHLTPIQMVLMGLPTESIKAPLEEGGDVYKYCQVLMTPL